MYIEADLEVLTSMNVTHKCINVNDKNILLNLLLIQKAHLSRIQKRIEIYKGIGF